MASRLPLLIALLIALVLLCGCGEDQKPAEPSHTSPEADAAVEAKVKFFAVYRKARRAHKTGQSQQAESLLREALLLQPMHEAATLLLVELRALAGDREESLAILRKLRKARPELDRPASLMAQILADTRPGWTPDPERAVTLFEEACRRNPNNSGPWLDLARVQRMSGNTDAARHSYETVLGTHVDSPLALLGLASLKLAESRPAAAVSFLVRALRAGTVAQGRKDVPSEMDTADSFAAGLATSGRNITALIALARAARALGAYPDEVPGRFRIRDLNVLEGIGSAAEISTRARGWPVMVDRNGDGVAEVVLPGAPEGGHPYLLSFEGGKVTSRELSRLPPRGSGAVADLDGDGRADLILGGLHPGDTSRLVFVSGFAGGDDQPPIRELPLTGRVLGSVTAISGIEGVLISREDATGRGALILLSAITEAGPQSSQLLDRRVSQALPVAGGLAIICDGGHILFLSRDDHDDMVEVPLLADRDPRASCLAQADVTGDGITDLLIGRTAPIPMSLQHLLGEGSDSFESIRYLAGRKSGGYTTRATPLPGVPPLPVLALVPIARPDNHRASILAICGDADPETYAPSRILSPASEDSYTCRIVTQGTDTHASAYAATVPPGWQNHALFMRGGLCQGNSRMPAIVILP